MKKRPDVMIFTLYDTYGASSKYRIYQYVDSIKEYANVKIRYFWPNSYVSKYMTSKKKYIIQIGIIYFLSAIRRIFQLILIAPKSDVVIIQKSLVPKLKPLFLFRVKSKKTRVIFDVDDAVYLDKKDNTEKIASIADCVICGSKSLVEHYSNFNSNTIFLPTVEDNKEYKKYKHDTFNDKIIGWIGNSINLRNLDLIVEPVNNIITRHPEVSFLLISDKENGYTKRIKNCRFVKWSPDSALKNLSNISVGIMPLLDNNANKGKCGFKLIQYMTMGKPVVASPVGENETIIPYGGMSANNAKEWENNIEKILYNAETYQFYVNKITATFSNIYNFDNNCEFFRNVICHK